MSQCASGIEPMVVASSDVDSDAERELLEEDIAGKSGSESARTVPRGESVSALAAQASNKPAVETKTRSLKWYKAAVKIVAKLRTREPASLSPKERLQLRKNRQKVASYERAMLGQSVAGSYEGTGVSSETAEAIPNPQPSTSKAAWKGPDPRANTGSGEAYPGSTTKGLAKPNLGERLKRIRSEEEDTNMPKKQKGASHKSPGAKGKPSPGTSTGVSTVQKPCGFLDKANPDLCLAVVDRNDPDGKIPVDKWLNIERALLIAMSRGGSADDCAFQGAGWHRGVKVVVCENGATKAFVARVISEMGEPWPGAKLGVVLASELPLRSRVRIWIPPPEIPVEDVLNILALQNRNLPIKEWKVLSSANDKKGKGRDFLFLVDDVSLQQIRSSAGQLKFGLSTVRARIDGGPDRQAQGGAN